MGAPRCSGDGAGHEPPPPHTHQVHPTESPAPRIRAWPHGGTGRRSLRGMKNPAPLGDRAPPPTTKRHLRIKPRGSRGSGYTTWKLRCAPHHGARPASGLATKRSCYHLSHHRRSLECFLERAGQGYCPFKGCLPLTPARVPLPATPKRSLPHLEPQQQQAYTLRTLTDQPTLGQVSSPTLPIA